MYEEIELGDMVQVRGVEYKVVGIKKNGNLRLKFIKAVEDSKPDVPELVEVEDET